MCIVFHPHQLTESIYLNADDSNDLIKTNKYCYSAPTAYDQDQRQQRAGQELRQYFFEFIHNNMQKCILYPNLTISQNLSKIPLLLVLFMAFCPNCSSLVERNCTVHFTLYSEFSWSKFTSPRKHFIQLSHKAKVMQDSCNPTKTNTNTALIAKLCLLSSPFTSYSIIL